MARSRVYKPNHLLDLSRRIAMPKEAIESYIRERTRSTKSTESIINLSHWLQANGIGPDHNGLKRTEIEDRVGEDLNYTVGTVLTHLTEIGLVEEFAPPGPSTLVIAEWLNGGDGDIVNGEVGETAREGLQALIDDLETVSDEDATSATATDGSGPTKRGVVSGEFALVPEMAEDYLRTTDDPVDTLNDAVDAIEEADNVEVGDDYGKIAFINMPYRYRLTHTALGLYV